jgi:hypothetical protein
VQQVRLRISELLAHVEERELLVVAEHRHEHGG